MWRIVLSSTCNTNIVGHDGFPFGAQAICKRIFIYDVVLRPVTPLKGSIDIGNTHKGVYPYNSDPVLLAGFSRQYRHRNVYWTGGVNILNRKPSIYPTNNSFSIDLETMRTPCVQCSLAMIVLVHSTNVHGLSSPATSAPNKSNRNKPIRKIAIVGSGIAGLSLAHAFENSPDLFAIGDGSPIKVTVYDARPSLNYEAGAGVQLNGGKAIHGWTTS